MTRALLTEAFKGMAQEQRQMEGDLLQLPNVVGVGLGNKITEGKDVGRPAIHVLVSQKVDREYLDKGEMVQPKLLGKYETDVIDVGEIFAQNLIEPAMGEWGWEYRTPNVSNGTGGASSQAVMMIPQPTAAVSLPPALPAPFVPAAPVMAVPHVLRQRVRPAMGGFSVGHPRVTAGTIATCCYDDVGDSGIPRTYYILSNNHVLANSNDANLGDPILQPGAADGGSVSSDVIGRLARFITIKFHTPTDKPLNYVDAALAEIPFHEASREIYWIGYLAKRRPAVLNIGTTLQKTGRTTNFSTGKVISLNATVDVNYGGGKVARFADQIVTTAMSAGGDSGSLVTDLEERAVGLLFAGSSTHTIINSIARVESLLKIRVTEVL